MTAEKQLNGFKKIVLKTYPKAYIQKLSEHSYTIVELQDDLSILDLLGDLYIPSQPTEDLAWERTAQSVQIMQNINRSHPLRAVFNAGEDGDEARISKLK
jgi:hypothetical protein